MSGFNYYYDDGSDRHRKKSSSSGRFVLLLILLAMVICGVLFYIRRSRNSAENAAARQEKPAPMKIPEKKKEMTEIAALPAIPAVSAPRSSGAKKEAGAAVALPAGETEIQVRTLLDANDPVAARDLALAAIRKCEFASPEFRRLGALLRTADMRIINGAVPCPQVIRYSVKNGDSLYNISRDHNLPMEILRRSNQLSDGNAMIRPGQVLKIYRGKWKIKVGKKASLLCVYDGDNLFSLYDIGTGREGRTPTGEFKIEDKIINPPWYAPDGRIVPFGDKENVLGTRWLKLKPVGATDPYQIGYGIHGTWDEGSITRPLSNGCIRMRNADVEELYDYIPRQTPVTISE